MDRRLRIALVVTGGLDRSGQHVIPALLTLLERLARRHSVAAFVLRYQAEPASYPLCGATVHDLGRPSGLWSQYRHLLRALARHGPFDVIHGYWALPSGLAAAAAGRRLGRPSVVTFDSGELVAVPEIGYGLQLRWRHRLAVATTARLASRVTVCTEYMHRLAARSGIDAEIVPIGVDPAVFQPGPTVQAPPWRLLHVASLNRVKDQATLLDAFRVVSALRTDVVLDIVGEDTLGGRVQAHAEQAGLGGRVTFHGPLPSDELVAFYRRAHLFVLSSRHEAAGVVLLEAASCGVPVAGPRVGYLADWAPHGATAVSPANHNELAQAILALLGDHARRARQANAAREWALAHDADWTAERFAALYRRLMRPR